MKRVRSQGGPTGWSPSSQSFSLVWSFRASRDGV